MVINLDDVLKKIADIQSSLPVEQPGGAVDLTLGTKQELEYLKTKVKGTKSCGAAATKGSHVISLNGFQQMGKLSQARSLEPTYQAMAPVGYTGIRIFGA